MRLYVMRHGEAGDYSTDPETERSRGLTSKGRKQVAVVAREMLDADELPKHIFASPMARTTETADIVGRILGVKVTVLDALGPHYDLSNLVADLLDSDEERRIMLVGHNDNISDELFGDSFPAADETAEFDGLEKAEVRRLKIDRKSGAWKEKWRAAP